MKITPPQSSQTTDNHPLSERNLTPRTPFLTAKKLSVFLIFVVLLLLTGVSTGLRCYYREPVSDDFLYRFILDDKPLGENDYSQLVQNIGDAAKSQSVQYFHSNGRTLIHILVQMFAGPWGFDAFAAFEGILIVAIMTLLGVYCFPRHQRYNPLLWLLISITYLYLFPGKGSWYSIAAGLNYLFPMLLVLVFLYLIDYSRKQIIHNNVLLIMILSIVGLVTGWSQECYSLPLSGSLFLTLAYKCYKKEKISIYTWVLTISLWMGTAILVLAPGNFVRLASRPGVLGSIRNGIHLLIGTYTFWALLICLVALKIYNKRVLSDFIIKNRLMLLALLIGICFGMIANTLPQSFNGISFYSSILLFRLSIYIPKSFYDKTVRNIAITVIGIVVLSIHQFRIVSTIKSIQVTNAKFVAEYLESMDGVVRIPEFEISKDVKPFVSTWFSSSVSSWLMSTLEKGYTNGKKHIFPLDDMDWSIYMDSNNLGKQATCVDNRGVFQSKKYIWFNENIAPEIGDSLLLEVEYDSTLGVRNKIRAMLGNPNTQESENIKMEIKENNYFKSPQGLVAVKFEVPQIMNIKILNSEK